MTRIQPAGTPHGWTRNTLCEDYTIEELIRAILRHVGTEASPGDEAVDDGPRMTILDLAIDGTRYTLTRHNAVDEEQSNETVSLSPREREIVRLVAKGLPNKTIAAVLDISPWTVSTHLRRIFAKLQVTSRAQMVAYAMEANIINRQ